MILSQTDPSRSLDKSWINAGVWSVLLALYLFNVWPAIAWTISQGTLLIPQGILSLLTLLGCGVSVRVFGFPAQRLTLTPLLLIIICAGLSLFTASILQQISAAFAILGLYGFAAGFTRVNSGVWRQCLVLAGLVSLTVPFALVRGTGFGFYLRLMTADAAAQILGWFGFASLGAHDVLIFDNGIAQVDAPCSGLKSLFTGTGFFLTATLVLRRRVSWRWLGLYGAFIGLLLVANTVRVITLIYLSEIAGKPEIAEAIHVPLGLVLFSLCCVFGLYGLTRLKAFTSASGSKRTSATLVNTGLAVIVLGLMTFAQFKSVPSFTPNLEPPQSLGLENIDLTETEISFFKARDHTQAQKWLFTFQEISGSMLVVQSRAANGLHAPEICFLGNGISVNSMNSRSDGSHHYRWLSVDENRRSAMYWMQSGDQVTDNFQVRLSRFVFGGHRDWTLVTILLDERHKPDADAVQTLRQELINHYKILGN